MLLAIVGTMIIRYGLSDTLFTCTHDTTKLELLMAKTSILALTLCVCTNRVDVWPYSGYLMRMSIMVLSGQPTLSMGACFVCFIHLPDVSINVMSRTILCVFETPFRANFIAIIF